MQPYQQREQELLRVQQLYEGDVSDVQIDERTSPSMLLIGDVYRGVRRSLDGGQTWRNAALVVSTVTAGRQADDPTKVLLQWNDRTVALRHRVAFLRRELGDEWPDWSDAALLASLDARGLRDGLEAGPDRRRFSSRGGSG